MLLKAALRSKSLVQQKMAAIAAQQGLATASAVYDSRPVQDALSQGALPHKLMYGLAIGGASYLTALFVTSTSNILRVRGLDSGVGRYVLIMSSSSGFSYLILHYHQVTVTPPITRAQTFPIVRQHYVV